MTPLELKNSILQLAIQGKLVPQLPGEGTGEELYRKIQSEKQALIKAGKIKKGKPLPEISDDEKPFDIPDSWVWTKFGDIVYYNMGKTPSRTESQWWGKDIPWVSIADMIENGQVKNTKERITESALSEVFGNKISKAGTLLMSFKLTVGRVSILNIDAVHNEAIISIYPCYDIDNATQMYLFKILPFISQYGKSKNAIKGKTLNSTSINNMLVPLPPLAEQKRIVAKIEELLPLVDRYAEAWNRLETLSKHFPKNLKKSLLQLAIQGKLVPQHPDEGTGEELYRKIQSEKQALIKAGKIKKEKPLPEISDNEKPFDIPESWAWVHIGELFQHNTGKALNSSDKAGLPYEYITTSNVYWNSFELDKLKTMLFTDDEVEKCTVQKGDLLVLEGGDIGRAAIWNYDFPMRIQNHIHRLRPYGNICIEYFYHIFYLYKGSGLINGKGIGIQGLSSNVLHKLIVPLPPLAEQKRIVAKLEEILPLCERLK